MFKEEVSQFAIVVIEDTLSVLVLERKVIVIACKYYLCSRERLTPTLCIAEGGISCSIMVTKRVDTIMVTAVGQLTPEHHEIVINYIVGRSSRSDWVPARRRYEYLFAFH